MAHKIKIRRLRKTKSWDTIILKKMKVSLSIFCRITLCLGPYTRGSNYDFWLADETFQKTKMEDKK